MKLLLIVDDYLPHSIKVAAKMMHELAIEMKSKGHEVSVLTPDVNLDVAYNIDLLDEIQVCRFRSGKIKNTGRVQRAINEFLLSIRAWHAYKKYFKTHKYDAIIYYSPSIFFGPLVWRLKKLWKVKSYLIVRDFFPQWAIDQGMINKYSPITLFFRIFEFLNYRVANRIGIQSPKNLEWFKNNVNVRRTPLDLLYNWAKAEKIVKKDIVSYRKKLGLENKIVLFYGGNIGHAQDMMNLMRLAKNLQGFPSAHFLFVGDGDEVSLVKKFIKTNQLKNTTYLPPVDQEEFKCILSEFDIGLFSLSFNHETHNFPGKLLGYMVEQIPILGSVNPNNDLKLVVEEAEAGFITINGDDKQLMQNAIKLVEDEQLRKKMGNNAHLLLKDKFSVSSAADKILENL